MGGRRLAERLRAAVARAAPGSAPLDSTTARDVVRALYVAILEREPDPEGWALHADRLEAGLRPLLLVAELARARDVERGGPASGPVAVDTAGELRLTRALAGALTSAHHDEALLSARIAAGHGWAPVLTDLLEEDDAQGRPAFVEESLRGHGQQLRALARRLAAIEDRLGLHAGSDTAP